MEVHNKEGNHVTSGVEKDPETREVAPWKGKKGLIPILRKLSMSSGSSGDGNHFKNLRSRKRNLWVATFYAQFHLKPEVDM